MKIYSMAVARYFLPTVLQSFESYPGPGCNFELFEMVVPHAEFKVFKVGPSARVPMGSKENDDLEHGGGALCFTNFAAKCRVIPRAGAQL